MDELFKFQKEENSFKALVTDHFSYWQNEQVSVLFYGAIYNWIFTFHVLISQRQMEFPIFLPVSLVLFASSLWKMRRFQAEIFLRKYPKYYVNRYQWNNVLFDRFRRNRLLKYIKKRGWGVEQIQIIRPEVKERADKIIAQSLLKKAISTVIMESVIAQFFTDALLPTVSKMGVTKIELTIMIWGSLFIVFYILLVHLEMFRIELSDLGMFQDLHKKLGAILLKGKLK